MEENGGGKQQRAEDWPKEEEEKPRGDDGVQQQHDGRQQHVRRGLRRVLAVRAEKRVALAAFAGTAAFYCDIVVFVVAVSVISALLSEEREY